MVLKLRPMIERTRMFSESPLMPGRSAQTRARQGRSLPRLRSLVERSNRFRFEQRIHLGDDARALAGKCRRVSFSMAATMFACSENGACQR